MIPYVVFGMFALTRMNVSPSWNWNLIVEFRRVRSFDAGGLLEGIEIVTMKKYGERLCCGGVKALKWVKPGYHRRRFIELDHRRRCQS